MMRALLATLLLIPWALAPLGGGGWPVSEISNLLISLAESGGVLIPKRMICDYE